MGGFIDFLAFVMTAATLCCLVRYGIYPVFRLVYRVVSAIARYLARQPSRLECESLPEHVAEVCDSTLMVASSRQRTNHD